MSDDKTPEARPGKGGKKKLILLVAGAVLLGGGGVGAGLWAGSRGTAGAAHEDVDHPKLVVKEGQQADENAGGPKGSGSFNRLKYQATYAPIELPFTSNLLNSDSVVQTALGVSTYYDARVLDAVKADDAPIRSEVLMLLANQDPEVISTPAGKKALQKALKKAINDVLIDKEGFGGVDDVYFTSFIIQ